MKTTKNNLPPPQLIDVLDDVLSCKATSFRLTREPNHIMVAFSTHNRAGEIDYTTESGEEMMSYLIENSYGSTGSPQAFELEFENTTLKCNVSADNRMKPDQIEIVLTEIKKSQQGD